jgi:hypothetical protein
MSMSSTEQAPPPKAPAKKKATPPTTTSRRGGPPTRGRGLRAFTLSALLAEISEPLALIRKIDPARKEWNYSAKCVELARNLNPVIPACEVLHRAYMQILEAMRKPLDESSLLFMVAMLMDSIGKRSGDDATENKLRLMIGEIADLGDPNAEMIGLPRTTNNNSCDDDTALETLGGGLKFQVSPMVLGVAVKTLISQQVYDLKPSDLRRHCVNAFDQLRGFAFRLDYMVRARTEIDQLMFRDGNEEEKAAAGRALGYDEDLESDDEDLETSNAKEEQHEKGDH